jgi:hypothetical protein
VVIIMKPLLITPAAQEPVTLSQAKLHLRVDQDHEDALIEALIAVAREQAEFLTGQRFVTQTWAIEFEAAASLSLYGLTPVQSITSDGAAFAVNGDLPPEVSVQGPATLTIICGFGAAGAVPASIYQWMLLRLAALYEQRESLVMGSGVTQAPHSFADALLDPYSMPRC